MTQFSARVKLFDNADSVAENPDRPVITGKMEIREDQIQALIDELQAADSKSYNGQKFKVINLGVWQSDSNSALLYSGKAKIARPRKRVISAAPKVAQLDRTRLKKREVSATPEVVLLAKQEEVDAITEAAADDSDY